MRAFKSLQLALLAAVCIYPIAVHAEDRTITFQAVSGADIALVQEIMASDDHLNDLMLRDYIRVPQDVRIAKADLDDSGEDEVLLMVKHNGDQPCTQAPCDFQIWKRADPWKKLGSYKMKEEKLRFYDEKSSGFHELANSQGIIPWNEK